MKVFLDSDVVISSFISKTGAAHLLVNNLEINSFISNYSQKEITIVVNRLKLKPSKFPVHPVVINKSLTEIKKKYGGYVTDSDDAHIIVGAVAAKTHFLVSYNLKHYRLEKIKRDLNILVVTPAIFLQYLRSL